MATFKSSLLNTSSLSSNSISTFSASDLAVTPSLMMLKPDTEPVIEIDSDLRKITVPSELYDIGVVGDHLCEIIYFRCPRYFDSKDLSEHDCVIRYINAGKEYGESSVVDMTVESDFLHFGWAIDNYVTRYSGVVNFTVQFETVEDGIKYQWQTKPAQLNIMAGLNIEETITDKDDVLFRTLSKQIQELQKSVEQLKTQVLTIDELSSQVDTLSSDVKYLQENVVYALDE